MVMASLRARHQESCPLTDTRFEQAREKDGVRCTCKPGPMFVLVTREGRTKREEKVGRNGKLAAQALTKRQRELDTGAYREIEDITFSDWADKWIDLCRQADCKENTIRSSYQPSMNYAKDFFKGKVVRTIGVPDISRYASTLREKKGLTPEGVAKHIRILAACLEQAKAHSHHGRNPARDFQEARGRTKGGKGRKQKAAYFMNEELPRLFAQLHDPYKTMFRLALVTGMREGELIALTWGDVNLQESMIHVRESYTSGHLSDPKDREPRDVDLTEDEVEFMGRWWGECGKPTDDKLVFPGEAGGYMSYSTITRRQLYPAMERAGIPRECPDGKARGVKRTFHSFRHTHAKIALERGAPIYWLAERLGHSSPKVTTDRYGHWETAERKRQTQMLAGAFSI